MYYVSKQATALRDSLWIANPSLHKDIATADLSRAIDSLSDLAIDVLRERSGMEADTEISLYCCVKYFGVRAFSFLAQMRAI